MIKVHKRHIEAAIEVLTDMINNDKMHPKQMKRVHDKREKLEELIRGREGFDAIPILGSLRQCLIANPRVEALSSEIGIDNLYKLPILISVKDMKKAREEIQFKKNDYLFEGKFDLASKFSEAERYLEFTSERNMEVVSIGMFVKAQFYETKYGSMLHSLVQCPVDTILKGNVYGGIHEIHSAEEPEKKVGRGVLFNSSELKADD